MAHFFEQGVKRHDDADYVEGRARHDSYHRGHRDEFQRNARKEVYQLKIRRLSLSAWLVTCCGACATSAGGDDAPDGGPGPAGVCEVQLVRDAADGRTRTTRYGYDSSGNLLYRDIDGLEEGDGEFDRWAEFLYAPPGRRVEARTMGAGGWWTTTYTWDGDGCDPRAGHAASPSGSRWGGVG